MDNDKAPEGKRASARLARATKVRKALPTPAEIAAEITACKVCQDRWSMIGKARRRVDAYDRWLARLLLKIDPLPPSHPKRKAALAKIWVVRPQRMQAAIDVICLQIACGLLLQDTAVDGMVPS